MGLHHLGKIAFEWRIAGQHLIGDHADAVNIGAGVEPVSAALLRRHVKRSAQDCSDACQSLGRKALVSQ